MFSRPSNYSSKTIEEERRDWKNQQRVIVQQYREPPHWFSNKREFPDETFPYRWISRSFPTSLTKYHNVDLVLLRKRTCLYYACFWHKHTAITDSRCDFRNYWRNVGQYLVRNRITSPHSPSHQWRTCGSVGYWSRK